MINRFLMWYKFGIRVSQEVLNKAPCQKFTSWVLISEKENDDCQGSWYERFFYSRETKKLFYGLSDRYIFSDKAKAKKMPIVEFVEMNPDYIAKMPIDDMNKIVNKIKNKL